MHAHQHHHGHHARIALGWAIAFTSGFAVVELLGGWWSGSLALASDGVHMLSDAVALAIALFGTVFGARPASARHSYGLQRAEVITALANAIIMLAVVVLIAVEATQRLLSPQPVAGQVVIAVALIGLCVNAAVAFVLSREPGSFNLRAAMLHVLGDLLGSVAALIAGTVVYYTGWLPIDPILSLAIAALILTSTFSLLRDILHVLMEGVPPGISLEQVGLAIAGIAGVGRVHDLHIWKLSSQSTALSAHIEVTELARWPEILAEIQALLQTRFGIDHVTLQPETPVTGGPAHVARVRVIRSVMRDNDSGQN